MKAFCGCGARFRVSYGVVRVMHRKEGQVCVFLKPSLLPKARLSQRSRLSRRKMENVKKWMLWWTGRRTGCARGDMCVCVCEKNMFDRLFDLDFLRLLMRVLRRIMRILNERGLVASVLFHIPREIYDLTSLYQTSTHYYITPSTTYANTT